MTLRLVSPRAVAMAKSKTATIAAAPSSNWKSLRAVRYLERGIAPLLFADFSVGQALNPAAATTTTATATSKDSHKRKRRHSSVASVDESRSAEPSTSSSKGKAKAVEANGEHDEGRVKGKRVRANKQLVPVDEIIKGGTAPWQQEYVLQDSVSGDCGSILTLSFLLTERDSTSVCMGGLIA